MISFLFWALLPHNPDPDRPANHLSI